MADRNGRRRNVHTRLSERGASMVEFVVVLPVLVILIFGIIEAGVTLNRQQALHAAAREGARVASIPSNSVADAQAAAATALGGLSFDGTVGTASVSPGSCAGRRGEQVTVVLEAPNESFDVPLLPSISLAMRGEGVFRCE